MRYGSIAADGGVAIHMPNLDRLVARGVGFDGCCARTPGCMPARRSVTTDRLSRQTGVTDNGRCLAPGFELTVGRRSRLRCGQKACRGLPARARRGRESGCLVPVKSERGRRAELRTIVLCPSIELTKSGPRWGKVKPEP
ncbi:MAG: hypothetical protein GVY16_01335 [Planctomycetes bacterium]|nr:hypothetical protein [Planctomycetota bacterium]